MPSTLKQVIPADSSGDTGVINCTCGIFCSSSFTIVAN